MIAYFKWVARNLKGIGRFIRSNKIVIIVILAYFYLQWRINTDSVPANQNSQRKEEVEVEGAVRYDPPVLPLPWSLVGPNVCGYAIQGHRASMEDRMEMITDLKDSSTSVYIIMDGHGGQFSVDFLRVTLTRRLRAFLDSSSWLTTSFDVASGTINKVEHKHGSSDSAGVAKSRASLLQAKVERLKSWLRREILDIDRMLLTHLSLQKDYSGTTLLLAVIHDGLLIVANVGDSRGILQYHNGTTIPISIDHKPDVDKEKARILSAGGFVIHRGVWRVGGILAMSRALGDRMLKVPKPYVISEPDIFVYNLADNRSPIAEFLVLATDGLWDTFKNEEVGEFIQERLSEPCYGALSAVLESLSRGSMDNISVLVVKLGSQAAARTRNATTHAGA